MEEINAVEDLSVTASLAVVGDVDAVTGIGNDRMVVVLYNTPILLI